MFYNNLGVLVRISSTRCSCHAKTTPSSWMYSSLRLNRSHSTSSSPSASSDSPESDLIGDSDGVITSSKGIVIKTGHLARFADGSCTVQQGDTCVLVTAVGGKSQKPNQPSSFLPLTVDYRQKASAAGRIPTTHLRRELGTTEKETLTSRMIDRSIRPLFPKGYYNETQVICNLLAVDGFHDPDILAINGASASLALSDIPWRGPIGAVRMGLIKDDLIVNPSRKELAQSRINLIMSATESGNIIMLDGNCHEPVSQPDIMRALKLGIKECKSIIRSISKLRDKYGRPKRQTTSPKNVSPRLLDSFERFHWNRLSSILMDINHDKVSRDKEYQALREDGLNFIRQQDPEFDSNMYLELSTHLFKKIYMEQLRKKQIRCDGRSLDQLRRISCSVDLFRPLHGSSMFQRGQTQVFCSCTFDSPDSAFRNDAVTISTGGLKDKNFMLHYEFPPYATNETGKSSSLGRREVGHGALAEKSLRPIVPQDVGMTIRLNCEVLESNGSSSMASVCAGSLALMDAGVRVTEPAAGVAIGLMSNLDNIFEINSAKRDESNRAPVRWAFDETSRNKEELKVPELEYYLLTDLLGLEDHMGDMDFKIAGTRTGMTGLQLDVKLSDGLPLNILREAIQKGHTARLQVLNLMERTIKEPRQERKDNHPVIKIIQIPPHKVSKFLGFGGCNIKKLMHDVGVRVTSNAYLDSDDQTFSNSLSTYTIFAPNQAALDEAEEYISQLIESDPVERELEFNSIYTATITEIRENGVMISMYPSMLPTLLHLKQLDMRAVKHPNALGLEVGQHIQVKYFGRDPATGQMRLSRKILQQTSASRTRNLEEKT